MRVVDEIEVLSPAADLAGLCFAGYVCRAEVVARLWRDCGVGIGECA